MKKKQEKRKIQLHSIYVVECFLAIIMMMMMKCYVTHFKKEDTRIRKNLKFMFLKVREWRSDYWISWRGAWLYSRFALLSPQRDYTNNKYANAMPKRYFFVVHFLSLSLVFFSRLVVFFVTSTDVCDCGIAWKYHKRFGLRLLLSIAHNTKKYI